MSTSSLEFPPILIGEGIGVQVSEPNGKPRKDREYVAGSTGFAPLGMPQALPVGFDELTRVYGAKVYDSMLVDPVVGGAFELLKLGVLASGLKLRARVEPKPGLPLESDPKAVKAEEIRAFCERAVGSMTTSMHEFLFDLLNGLAYGNRIAEIVCRVPAFGQDAGKLIVDRLKIKPRDAVSFVVDSTGEVLAFQGQSSDNGVPVILPREKFVAFAWQVMASDPRGNSCLRIVADPWSLKVQTWPEIHTSLQQFGSPSLIGTTAEGESERLPEDDDGNPIEGEGLISPQAYLSRQLSKFRNGRAIAVPSGTTVQVIEGKGEGQAFNSAINLFDRQIVIGLLKNARTMLEAEHGSKADGEIGQDVTGLVIRFVQAVLASCLETQLFHRLVEWNLGAEVADEFTPHVCFGETEHQDFATDAGAVAGLHRASYFTESQLPAVDTRLGLPARQPGEPRVSGTGAPAPTDPAQDPASPDPTGNGDGNEPPPTPPGTKPKPPKKGAVK